MAFLKTNSNAIIFDIIYKPSKTILIKIAEKIYQNTIQTELSDKLNFFVAEKYHHNYFLKNPNSIYCNALIPPKLKTLQTKYSNIFKN